MLSENAKISICPQRRSLLWTENEIVRRIRCKLYRRIISPGGTIGIIIVRRCGLLPAHTFLLQVLNHPPILSFPVFPRLSPLSLPRLSLWIDVLRPPSSLSPRADKTHDHINEANKSRLNGFYLNKECPVNCNRSSTTDALITKAIIVTNVKYR